MILKKHPMLWALLCLISLPVGAQDVTLNKVVEEVQKQLPNLGKGTLSFYLENDMFSNTDRNYTNGVRVSLASPNLERFDEDFIENEQLRAWYDWLNPRLGRFHPQTSDQIGLSSRRVVLTLGQQIYTPETRDATELLENERPYAGWLYLGAYYHARYNDQLKTLGLNLGVVGPASLAQEAQDLIHDIRDLEKFKGWDNQLENELGLQLVYEKKDKLINQTSRYWGYDMISHYGASLGNVATYLNAGGEFRLGWNIPDNFGTSALRSAADNHTPDGLQRRGWGVHGFVSVDGRWVLQDIFLDGNTFTESHSVKKKPWVADAAAGISLAYEEFTFSFARIIRSKEFYGQPKSHHYGSVSLSWNYQF